MATTLQDVGEAFGYLFKDQHWFGKLAMGALFVFLSMFIVGIPFLLGYMVWTTRNVIRREPYPLPEWTHFGDMFVTGLKLIATYIVYYIPFFLIIIIPLILFGILGFVQVNPGFIGAFFGYYIFVIIASIGYSLFLIPVYLRFAMTDGVGRSLEAGKVWRFFKANLVNVLLVLLLSWVAGLIGGLGIIILFVGVFFTQMYAYLIQAHLMGQMELAAQQDGTGMLSEDEREAAEIAQPNQETKQ
ncbi:DUF4013 domain-containing protein [Patescibacteria group bacterium]